MRRSRVLQFNIFAARRTELNNYLPLFLGSIVANKMYPEELNEILIHAVPNSWARKSYIQGRDFEERSYKETCDMFKRMEISEAIYEGEENSKNTSQAEAYRSSSGRKKKGGASASPSNPEQGYSGKRKRSNAGHPSNEPTGANKHACCMVPYTLQKSVHYYVSTPRSALRNSHTKTNNPSPAATNAANSQV